MLSSLPCLNYMLAPSPFISTTAEKMHFDRLDEKTFPSVNNTSVDPSRAERHQEMFPSLNDVSLSPSEDKGQKKELQHTMKTEEADHPCQCISPLGRNLVVCIDGTSNQFGKQVSLFIYLNSMILCRRYMSSEYQHCRAV